MKRWRAAIWWPNKLQSDEHNKNTSPKKRKVALFFTVVFILALACTMLLGPLGNRVKADPGNNSYCSGYTRVNALTVCYNGDYYYTQPEAPNSGPDDSATVKITGGSLDVTDGPVFWGIHTDSTEYCYNVLYYQSAARGTEGAGGGHTAGWVNTYAQKNSDGACSDPIVVQLGDPSNNSAASKILFFLDSSSNIESVRLSNATPFELVQHTFAGSDKVGFVYMEDEDASECPDIIISYSGSSNKFGYFSPTKGTPSFTDVNSTYRAVLRAQTGGDNSACTSPSGSDKNSVTQLRNTYEGANHSVDTNISFVNNDGDVAQLESGAVDFTTNSQAGGPALDRDDSTTALGSITNVANTGATRPSCEASGNPLNWILCPIYNGVANLCQWLFSNLVQPLLRTSPISTNPSDPSYQTWSQFRIYGDIFLVIALLVVVFGQSIGGGIVDAYTAKKVLPRLLIAAILINLSIYIVAFLVDMTNIIGGSIGQVMTAPLKNAGAFSITPSGVQSGTIVATPLLAGGVVAAGSIGEAGIAGFAGEMVGALASSEVLSFIGLFVLMPVLFGLIAAFITMIIRKAMILALVLVSPVAFALYCLPNTEKYFRKWWDLLIETLLVYPIVIIVFAVANIMSVTVVSANSSGNPLAAIISFVLQFLPLLMIPYAFKLAGGAVGRLHETLTNYHKRGQEAIKGNANDPNSLRHKVRREGLAKLAGANLSAKAAPTLFNPATAFTKKGRAKRAGALSATRNALQGYYGQQGMGAAMFEYNKDDSHITGDLAKHETSAASMAAIDADIAHYDEDTASGVAEGSRRGFARGSDEHRQRLFSSAAADKIGRDPAMRRRALMNPATIGYELGAGEEGWNQAKDAMHSIAGYKRDATTGEWSGGDSAMYSSLMNEFQYVAKSSAGRTDLAGSVDGGNGPEADEYNGYRAWTQVGMYQHGNGKPTSIKGSAQYFSNLWDRAAAPDGSGLTNQDVKNFTSHLTDDQRKTATPQQLRAVARQRAEQSVAVFTKELDNMGDSATGSVRDEAVKQSSLLVGKGGASLVALRDADPEVKKLARGFDREEYARQQRGGA